jgi:hypothetical protein
MDLEKIQAASSKAGTVFAGIVGSNTTQWIDVCLRLFCVCVGSGFATGWFPRSRSPAESLRITKPKRTKPFHGCTMFQSGSNSKKERETGHGNQPPNINSIFRILMFSFIKTYGIFRWLFRDRSLYKESNYIAFYLNTRRIYLLY